jgi:hypothetical protein
LTSASGRKQFLLDLREAFLTKTNYGQDIPFSDKCVAFWRFFGGAQEMF